MLKSFRNNNVTSRSARRPDRRCETLLFVVAAVAIFLHTCQGFSLTVVGLDKKRALLQPPPSSASIETAEWNAETCHRSFRDAIKNAFVSVLLVGSLSLGAHASLAVEGGASTSSNAKITTGGASTLQSGRTIAITRGVNLDGANFKGNDLKGVAFQQSIVRDANFQGTNLVGASFFDATLDGSDFENSDLTQANLEMAQLNRANLKNAVLREMYVSGATLFEGVKDISNTDWTDTFLRKDQQLYLCNHPTSSGTNPVTGADTRESLMCPD